MGPREYMRGYTMKQMATVWAFPTQEGEGLVTRILRLYASMVLASLLLTAK